MMQATRKLLHGLKWNHNSTPALSVVKNTNNPAQHDGPAGFPDQVFWSIGYSINSSKHF